MSPSSGVLLTRARGFTDSGFDVSTGKYLDSVDAGIVDPTKVVRVALEIAVSVASVLLLTEATLTEIAEPATHAERMQPDLV